MSQAKFAPITSALLARKGDAGPWPASDGGKPAHLWQPRQPMRDESEPDRATILEAVSRTIPAMPVQACCANGGGPTLADPAKMKKCTLRLTQQEYENLGIVGVKRGLSTQNVMRVAIEEYLSRMAREYRSACACLSNDSGALGD